MGVVIFGALAVYAIVLVAVTWLAYRWAAKRGLPIVKRCLSAAGGFLLIYLPVFWDHIPTLIAHKYYCEKEAGFWVYKTVEQWKSENQGVADTLTPTEAGRPSIPVMLPDGTGRVFLNERIAIDRIDRPRLMVSTTLHEERFVDVKSGEVLASRINVISGYGHIGVGGHLKFWLSLAPCNSDVKGFESFYGAFRQLGSKK